jgi:hypothetical protein
VPLSPPPRDANGNVLPHDHAEILNQDDIIRRISDQQIVEVAGRRRISSIAFQPSDGENAGVSIDIPKSIIDAGLDPQTFVTTPRWIGSVIFKADVPRSYRLQVGYDPILGNDHHGELWGHVTKGTAKNIQRACQWFVQIPDVAIS